MPDELPEEEPVEPGDVPVEALDKLDEPVEVDRLPSFVPVPLPSELPPCP